MHIHNWEVVLQLSWHRFIAISTSTPKVLYGTLLTLTYKHRLSPEAVGSDSKSKNSQYFKLMVSLQGGLKRLKEITTHVWNTPYLHFVTNDLNLSPIGESTK